MKLEDEVELQKKINTKMEASMARIIKKYGQVPMDPEDFNRFVADVYISGATDALETIGAKKKEGSEVNDIPTR